MANYLAPGVYVEEKPSAMQSIASNGTSTPGFIGIFGTTLQIPVRNEDYDPAKNRGTDEPPYKVPDAIREIFFGGSSTPATPASGGGGEPAADADTGDSGEEGNEEEAGEGGGGGPLPDGNNADLNLPYKLQEFDVTTDSAEVIFCANFSDFAKYFGNFSLDRNQNMLAQSVYGFFQNGGSSCYVTRLDSDADFDLAMTRFEAVDDIAIVVAPGITGTNLWQKMKAHCAKMNDRFAILDTLEAPAETDKGDIDVPNLKIDDKGTLPQKDKNSAVYFPWLQVVDPALKMVDPDNQMGVGDGTKAHAGRVYVPPGGHVAGVYARTDTERGVHKAPANASVRGIVGLRYNISKAQQDVFNPFGLNCIRFLNSAYTVWGARTIGGDSNGEWRYVNVRRTFINIMEDIDKGTQWAVFEPNDEALWAKITMNVSAYLEGRRRQGALFGTPDQAYFVKCDAETNPPADRELGKVTTLVGVSIVRPAEFVIFEISQMAPQA